MAEDDIELLQELAGYEGGGWGSREMAWLPWQGSMQMVVQAGGAQRQVVGWYAPVGQGWQVRQGFGENKNPPPLPVRAAYTSNHQAH